MAIRLIVGLGNPGLQYEVTRHNAGFWLLNELADAYHATFQLEQRFFGLVTKILIQGQPIYLLEPTTFMNRSGQAVQALSHFYKIGVDEILVVHDELDLPVGSVKLKQGGGHAGHNGLRDIIKHLGSPDFWRLRLGIGHPRTLGLQQQVFDYVLSTPRQADQAAIDQMLARSVQAITPFVRGEVNHAHQILRQP